MRLTLVLGVRFTVAVDLVEDPGEWLALDQMRFVDEGPGLAGADQRHRLGGQLVEGRRGSRVGQIEADDECEHAAHASAHPLRVVTI